MILVNGIEIEWRENFTIEELISEIKDNKQIFTIRGHGYIVIVNSQVLGVIEKYQHIIQDNDKIDIIQPHGGG